MQKIVNFLTLWLLNSTKVADGIDSVGYMTVELHGEFAEPPRKTFGFEQQSPEYGAVP